MKRAGRLLDELWEEIRTLDARHSETLVKQADQWNEEMAILGNALMEKDASIRDLRARNETLESAIKNALGTLQASYGDADPYVRCAADMLWQALEEKEVRP